MLQPNFEWAAGLHSREIGYITDLTLQKCLLCRLNLCSFFQPIDRCHDLRKRKRYGNTTGSLGEQEKALRRGRGSGLAPSLFSKV